MGKNYLLLLACLLFVAACDSGSGPSPRVIPSAAPSATAAATAVAGTPVATPVAGLGLSAQASDSVITLTWQPVAGARGYNVYRDGSSVPLNAVPLAETTYDDIGLTNGRTYTYTVIAVSQLGQLGVRSARIEVAPKSH